MNIVYAVLLGIIQGITEWLPISSSGHLAVAQSLLGLQVPVLFDILLHIATLLVVLIVFRKDIFDIFKAAIRLDFRSENGKLFIYLLIASAITGVVGYLFRDIFVSLFSNLFIIGSALFLTGFVLILCKDKKGKKKLNYKNSILIGLAQALAIIPGVSRSGLTVATGILSGVDRKKVARFSFILFIPAIIGALILEHGNFSMIEPVSGAIAFIVSFIVGFVSLKFLLKMIYQNKFWMFCFYCWIVGSIVIYLSYMGY